MADVDQLTGSLAQIADAMPCGFHDTELRSFVVSWPEESIRISGMAWVAEDEPDPEIYRPFDLTVHGLRSLLTPLALKAVESSGTISLAFGEPASCDGHQGWPPGREPERPPFPDVPAYSFFLHDVNDFITFQAASATLEWTGPSIAVKDPASQHGRPTMVSGLLCQVRIARRFLFS